MTMTQKAARALFELPPRRKLTADEITAAWKREIKTAHPDHGGTAELFAAVNEARDLLLATAAGATGDKVIPTDAEFSAPGAATDANTLVITPEAHLFGQSDIYVGKCGAVATAIAYCAAAGWNYKLTNELTPSQRLALEAAA
nr:hypothetical protein 2 [bacterium]